jgi:hypothetical protein
MAVKSILTSPLPVKIEKEVSYLLSQAIEIDGADMGNIQLFYQREQILTIIAQKGFDRIFLEYFETVKAFDSSACGRAIGIGSTVVISDVNLDIGFAPHRNIAKSAGFRAVKSVPLNDKDNNYVGVLSTHYKKPKWDWETKKITTITGEIAELLSPLLDGNPN